MPSRHGGPPRSPLAIVALVVYTLFLLGGPFLHTDVVCFGQARSHCVICDANHSTPALEDPRFPSVHSMAACGAPSRPELVLSPLLLTPRVTGRSPPA